MRGVTPFISLSVLVLLASASLPRQSRAQAEAEAERARLAAAYAAAPTLSNGCSLAEGERRAGLVDEAARRLDALLAAARTEAAEADDERATLSACRFNRARIHEDRGELRAAYLLLGQALATPNAVRRRVVEQRIVDVAASLVAASGCASLASRYAPDALLRFAENATLRRCVTATRRATPFCTVSAPENIPETLDGYGIRRVDPNTAVLVDDHFLMIVTTRGNRVSALECRLAGEEEQLGQVRSHMLGRTRVLEVTTRSRVSYACDDCEEGDDCRCGDDSETTYFVGPRGELLLALMPAWVEAGSMATWPHDAPELRDASESPTTLDGSVMVINGRRLRLVRGALVPAP